MGSPICSSGTPVSVWHTATEFTLDFLTLIPGGMTMTRADGTVATSQKARVVARVKLPPQQIWELMKALEAQLSAHESEQGNRGGATPMYPPFSPDDAPPDPPTET